MFNISPLFSLFKVYYHNFPGKNTRSRERTRPPLPHFRLSLAPLIFKSEKIPAFHQFSFDFFENTSILKGMFRASLSSRGLGHRVFIPATRVRIPMGMPFLQKRRTRVEFVLETEAGQSIGLLRFFVSVCRRVRFSSAETRSSPAEGSPFYQIIFRAE